MTSMSGDSSVGSSSYPGPRQGTGMDLVEMGAVRGALN